MVQRVPTCGKELAVRRKVGQTLSPESCEDLAIGTIAQMIEEQPHLSLFNDPEDGQQPNDKGTSRSRAAYANFILLSFV